MAKIKNPHSHICLEIISISGVIGFSPGQTRGLGLGWGGGGAQTHVQKFYFKFSIILKGIDMEDFSRAKMSQIKGKGILSNFGTTNDYALF